METKTAQRVFIITYVGQIATTYTTGKKLSFPQDHTDDKIAWEVNFKSGLQFLDLGLINKNENGELCFGTRMDGITSKTVVLKLREAIPLKEIEDETKKERVCPRCHGRKVDPHHIHDDCQRCGGIGTVHGDESKWSPPQFVD